MKISNSKTKNNRKKFFLSFSIIAIALVGSLIIYKNYNLYKDKENQEESTKVDADSTTLAYTINGKRQSGAFPTKSSGYGVNSVTCENGVTAEWDSTDWGLVNINANNNSSIKCSIDFATTLCKKATELHQEQCADSSPCYELDGYGIRDWISYGSIPYYLYTGDAFDCDVNGDGKYDSATERFYYISDYYDTETKTFDSNYATLVYYSNVSGGVSSYTATYAYEPLDGNGNCGPITAIKQLPTTSQWSNVVLKDTTRNILTDTNIKEVKGFSYEGYAARLLTYQEIYEGCSDGESLDRSKGALSANCQFLLESTAYSFNFSNYDKGFWTETYDHYDYACVFGVDAIDVMLNNPDKINDTTYGVRPAIDVPKKALSYS